MSLVALSLAAISANLGRLPYSPDFIYHVQRILLETDESAVQFICLKLLTKLYKRDKRNNKPLSPTRLIPFLDWLLRKEKRAAWDKSSGPNKLVSLFPYPNLLFRPVYSIYSTVSCLYVKGRSRDFFSNTSTTLPMVSGSIQSPLGTSQQL